jgi:hypothetical protein
VKFFILILVFFASNSFAQVNRFIDTGNTANISYTQGLPATPSTSIEEWAEVNTITNTTPAAQSFTCAITNICTATAHALITGTVVQVSNSGGALPTGLSASTNYYVIYLSANTFSLATSLANSLVPTAITISGTGTGVQTITATTLSGSVALQGSMDNITWFNLPIHATGDATKSGSFTGSGSIFLSEDHLNTNWVRANYTITSGQFTVVEIRKSAKALAKPY